MPAEDALAFFREAVDFRTVRLRRGRERRLRPDDRAAAAVRDGPARGVRASVARTRTRCCRRSPPRASRSSRTTATTRPAGSSPWRRAPTSHGDGCSPGSPRCWPLHAELLTAYGVGPEVDVVLDQVFAVAGSTARTSDRCPAGGTPRHCPGCSPRCRSWLARTRWGCGEDRGGHGVRRGGSRDRSRDADADAGGPRRAARRPAVRSRGRRDDHADVLRLSGDGDDARRPGAPARGRRVHCRASRSP